MKLPFSVGRGLLQIIPKLVIASFVSELALARELGPVFL